MPFIIQTYIYRLMLSSLIKEAFLVLAFEMGSLCVALAILGDQLVLNSQRYPCLCWDYKNVPAQLCSKKLSYATYKYYHRELQLVKMYRFSSSGAPNTN